MRRDPLVAEVRRIRRKIEAECGNDPDRLHALVKAAEAALGDRVVSYGPRRLRRLRKAG